MIGANNGLLDSEVNGSDDGAEDLALQWIA